jgi:flavodoxin/ferredoxin
MKSIVIYFSQTGNTKKAAEKICDGISAVTGQCDMKALGDVDAALLSSYDLVGLGCPTFYYQEPFNVREFMENLPDMPGGRWFIFCSHGSVIGNTFPSMAKRLKEKGIVVIGYHDTYADGTLPFYPYPTLTTGHPDTIDLNDALSFGKEIAERCQRIAEGDESLIPEVADVPADWTRTAEMMTPETMGAMLPPLSINTEKCTHCHACQDNCPVDGIDVEADPPRIQEPCVYCFHCANICPVLAVEADWSMLVAMAPENYARYREALDGAAERGEFRWLVDPDSMNFDDPLHEQRKREIEKAGEAGDSANNDN